VHAVAYVFVVFVTRLIDVLELCMVVRAILSWIDPMQEWKITAFLHFVTEPVIMPIRALFARMRWFEGFPLDVPFLVTWLLLMAIRTGLMLL
jgi:YggT family protein